MNVLRILTVEKILLTYNLLFFKLAGSTSKLVIGDLLVKKMHENVGMIKELNDMVKELEKLYLR